MLQCFQNALAYFATAVSFVSCEYLIFFSIVTCGLYYKHTTIVNDNLSDATILSIAYDHN
jgi:hypothetical protein